jgi:hypothetical protein
MYLSGIDIGMKRLCTSHSGAASRGQHRYQDCDETVEARVYSETVCSIMVASEMPKPAPPSSDGKHIPIQPSFAKAACKS